MSTTTTRTSESSTSSFKSTHPSLFPTYLIPTTLSRPFRRLRKDSNDSTASTDSTTSTATTTSTNTSISSSSDSDSTTKPTTPTPSTSHSSHLRCSTCATDLCFTSQIVSKGFTGRHGRAYLVSLSPPYSNAAPPPTSQPPQPRPTSYPHPPKPPATLPNTYLNKPVPRRLVTGDHVVSDVCCAFCDRVLGWKYVGADDASQRYKVGKVILETKRVRGFVEVEGDGDGGDYGLGMAGGGGATTDQIEFDSQDEDECEDLFLGIWTPSLAGKRRRGRRLVR